VSHGGITKIGRGNGGFHSAARDFARYLTSECEGLGDGLPEPLVEGAAHAFAGYAIEDAGAVVHLAVTPGVGTRVGLISVEQLEAMLSWQGVDGDGEHGLPRANSVLALDKTFNVPKPLSVLAGLDDDFAQVLERAMYRAAQVSVEALAGQAVARVGPAGGQVLVDAVWVEAAVAMHRTSRAGDPHWHAHTVLPTRVLVEVDGELRWAGMWTTPLFKDQRRLNRIFDATLLGNPELRDALAERGCAVVDGEVLGVDARIVAEFSRRRAEIDVAVARLGAQWSAAQPGVTPSAATVAGWREQAQKATRAEKDHSVTLDVLRDRWRQRAAALGLTGAGTVAGDGSLPLAGVDAHEVARRAVDRLGAEQSRWHDGDVQAKVFDELTRAGVTSRDPQALIALGEQISALVIAEYCLPILDDPELLDHATRARVRAWTSVEVLRQEQQLRDLLGARAHVDADVTRAEVARIESCARRPLDRGQLVAAARIAGAESLVVIEGAAGVGKTTMLDAAIRAVHADGRRVLLLAPSATAAKVAGDETGTPTATLHGFLRAHGYQWSTTEPLHRLPAERRPVPEPDNRFWLRPGDVLVFDEAGMADQDTMRAVLTIAAETPGVRVRLVGDRAQLDPVGKGGVLAMAAEVVPVTDLTDVHRFRQPGWAALSLLLRDRHPDSLAHLVEARAVFATKDRDVTAALFAHHLAADLANGRDALGVVATNEHAAVTNAAVQAALVQAGKVQGPTGGAVAGCDGLTAGVGDRITTRLNAPRLGLLNRETWTVTGHAPDGALHVRGADGNHRTLPAGYVREHTHLAYAVTAHGAQGRTVDVARLLADDASGAAVYVGATRGRDTNHIYLTAQNADDAIQTWAEILDRDNPDEGITIEARKARRELSSLGLRTPRANQPRRQSPAPEPPLRRVEHSGGHSLGL